MAKWIPLPNLATPKIPGSRAGIALHPRKPCRCRYLTNGVGRVSAFCGEQATAGWPFEAGQHGPRGRFGSPDPRLSPAENCNGPGR